MAPSHKERRMSGACRRSWDGLTLYAASSDGTIAVFHFDPEELEGIAPHSVQEQYLSKFMFSPPPIPEGYSHIPTNTTDTRMTPPPSPGPQNTSIQNPNQTAEFTPVNGAGEHVNVLVAKRSNKNKKRVPLASASSVPSAGSGAAPPVSTRAMTSGGGQNGSRGTTTAQSSSNFPSPDEQPFADLTGIDGDVDMDVPINSLFTSTPARKRKASLSGMDGEDGRVGKARTLGGDRVREVVPVKELVMAGMGRMAEVGSVNLPTATLLTFLRAEVEGTEDVLEARNTGDDGQSFRFHLSRFSHSQCLSVDATEVMFVGGGKQTMWLDYLPSPALAVKATSCFCAVAMVDGSVNVYSHTGRR